jgi:rhodanese-related sulfurtransferase
MPAEHFGERKQSHKSNGRWGCPRAAMLWFVVCLSGAATLTSAEEISEVRELSCAVESEVSQDQTQPEVEWRVPATVTLTAENYIGAMQLAAEREKVTVIDTRRAEQFAQVHLPGSINLPGYAIKTKLWLKDHRVVLVDAGDQPLSQQTLFQELKRSGFDHVWILDGGLTGWLRQGGSVEGDPFAAKQMNQIDAKTLVSQLGWPGWKVIRLRRYAANQEMTLPLEAVDIEVGNANETPSLLQLDQQIRRWQEKEPDLRVVLVGGQHLESWQMQHYADTLTWPRVYWVEGGSQALVKAVEHRKRLLAPAGRQGAKHPCTLH